MKLPIPGPFDHGTGGDKCTSEQKNVCKCKYPQCGCGLNCIQKKKNDTLFSRQC